jgi:nucleotide-binding universal stress UspA family protein
MITALSVTGYKSIAHEQSIEIRPLTLLCGDNGSGKSSIMQPALLWKQTIEAGHDPGPLLLSGPRLCFTSFDQLLSRVSRKRRALELTIGMRLGKQNLIHVCYAKRDGEIAIVEMTQVTRAGTRSLSPSMSSQEILRTLKRSGAREDLEVVRDRCFLAVHRRSGSKQRFRPVSWAEEHEQQIRRIIHLPAWRGSIGRTHPVAALGAAFPGSFEPYMATLILQWQSTRDVRLSRLEESARNLGLFGKLAAVRLDDTQIDLRVGDGPRRELVNLAGVGRSVSHVLPVLVALQAAEPGQLVYIEQPERHLHPRAQGALADVLAEAARRGVRVVAETHSRHLLLGVQTQVAEGKLSPELVRLHWFERDARGETLVRSSDLDKAGAYGDWPEDLERAALQAEGRYLDAHEAQCRRS